jgi:hypothetical protein
MALRDKIDWPDCPFVEVKPGVQSGAPVLRGARMPVDALVALLGLAPTLAHKTRKSGAPGARLSLTPRQGHYGRSR